MTGCVNHQAAVLKEMIKETLCTACTQLTGSVHSIHSVFWKLIMAAEKSKYKNCSLLLLLLLLHAWETDHLGKGKTSVSSKIRGNSELQPFLGFGKYPFAQNAALEYTATAGKRGKHNLFFLETLSV
jgi:hypothetical protein